MERIALIIVGLLVFALGVACLRWPRLAWKVQYFPWVKGGEPTEFALIMINLTAIAYLLTGATFVGIGLCR